ncbi:hypothetical protein [Scytonema sp. PCC 10023]|uniref:hypothetical protein n=1 Tax=Scytonema sp. PCC 10023 TaxID=1680591 RepID=UPI0039C75CA4
MNSQRCNCKICRNSLAEFTNGLAESGLGFSAIKKRLKDHYNFETTETVIKRHLQSFDLIRSEQETTAIEIDDFEYPTFALDDIGLQLQQYDFDPKNPLSIIQYLQKCHLGIYLKQLAIVYQKVSEYEQGLRGLPPTTEINDLKKLFELLDSITGISVFSNQQAAIQKVQNMGYSIEQYNLITSQDMREEN